MTTADWGPPNLAAHTAGQVQREPSPLRPADPPSPTPSLAVLPASRRTWVDDLRDDLAQALGHGWTVDLWEEPWRWRMGITARHSCGFKVISCEDMALRNLPVTAVVAELTSDVLGKERRHSCEAIGAAVS